MSSQLFKNADAYQRFMGRWSTKLAEVFLDFAGLDDGERVLDVGSGTGNLSGAILRRAPHAKVTGVDPSPEYFEYARSRVPSATFVVADAGTLPFEDASFDRALCQLVLNFVPDCRRALAEMRRVTRAGGSVAAVNWNFGGMRMLDDFWDATGTDGDGSRFGERSRAFTKEDFVALWREAGLNDIRAADLAISTDFASFDDYWSPFLLGQGPAGVYAVSLPHDKQAALRERLRERFFGDRADGPFSLEARAFAVLGVVPSGAR